MSCLDYQEDHVGLHLPDEQPYCLYWGKQVCVLGWDCKWEGKPTVDPESDKGNSGATTS